MGRIATASGRPADLAGLIGKSGVMGRPLTRPCPCREATEEVPGLGGEGILRKFIAEEILARSPKPSPEIAKAREELATVQAEVNRLVGIATPANRDFVDERLGKIRARKQELESRLADLERVDFGPVDLEAATRNALAHIARFRDVLEEGHSRTTEGVPAWIRARVCHRSRCRQRHDHLLRAAGNVFDDGARGPESHY